MKELQLPSMPDVKIKGFQIFKDRHGKLRCYHRKSGLKIDLIKYPLGSVGFLGECGRIEALGKQKQAVPGTLGALVLSFKATIAYSDFAPKTKKNYLYCFQYLENLYGYPLVNFNAPMVAIIRDNAAKRGRRFSAFVKSALSMLFKHAVEQGWMDDNPALKIQNVARSKEAPRLNRPWSDAERHVVLEALPSHIKPIFALMMYTGLDIGDAVKLPRTALRMGLIETWRSKTGEHVAWRAPAPLLKALREAPKHDAITLCANSGGRPWTPDGLRASWRKVKLKLEDEKKIGFGLTPKGLRHTVATILRELGYDLPTIAKALGQKTIKMADHYSRDANETKKMDGVVKDFSKELAKRRTKIVKPTA